MWVVELEKGIFINQGQVTTSWFSFAKRFKTEAAAKAALTNNRKVLQRQFKNAKIYPVEE